MSEDYTQFLHHRAQHATGHGFGPPPALFDETDLWAEHADDDPTITPPEGALPL